MICFFGFVIYEVKYMSVLKQYLIRKGYNDEVIRQTRESGTITVPPDWINYFAEEQMMFSHRCNQYASGKQYSPDNELHAHGYYELVIHIRGEAEYIQNDSHIHPLPYTVVWCRPGNMHAVRLYPCEFERYLLYFSPEFFTQNAQSECPILAFTEKDGVFAFQIDEDRIHTLRSLLERIEQAFQADVPYKSLLVKALIVELFAFFNADEPAWFASENLDDPIAEIKKYIDRNYADIAGIEQIAAEFHYSREHLSRKFKGRFNTSISEYLSRRRIIESIRLLPLMSITEACYAVGFRNPSAYIAAFKKNMGCLPSEYKNRVPKEG